MDRKKGLSNLDNKSESGNEYQSIVCKLVFIASHLSEFSYHTIAQFKTSDAHITIAYLIN
jgi:hypothetical protein